MKMSLDQKQYVYFFICLLFTFSSLAEEYIIDPDTQEFDSADATPHYLLKGNYPQLAKINRCVSPKGAFFDLQGHFSALTQLHLKSTSGPINVWLKGCFPALAVIELKSTSGDITFDLKSPLAEKTALVIKTTSGDIHLRLPASVFAKVEAKTSTGSIKVYGMQKSIWCWSAYCYTSFKSREDYQIEIQLETTCGQLFIEQQI